MVAREYQARSQGGWELICVDCGQPQHIAVDPLVSRRRLTNLGMMLALMFAGGLLFVMVTLLDATSPSLEPARQEQEHDR